MNIYTLVADLDGYKYYLPVEGCGMVEKTNSYDGRSLVDGWRSCDFDIFNGKTRKEQKRSEDFNVSHYYSRLCLVSAEIKCEIEEVLLGKVEFLPVGTSNNKLFFFMNVINVINSIDAESWDDYARMEDENNYSFLEICDDELVFRDSVYNLNYFFTEKFSRYMGQLGLRGCFFEKVGVSG